MRHTLVVSYRLRAIALSLLLLAGLLGSLLPSAALASSEAAPLQNSYYVVKRGDTLAKIAYRYGTTVHALVRANGLSNPNHIYVWQKIHIPSGGYGGPLYRDGGYAKPVHRGGYGEGCASQYRVKYGDTLAKIARWHGVNMHSLERANGIADPSQIYIGQHICITHGYGYGYGHDGSQHVSGHHHKVKQGDTLAKIARWYGTSVHRLTRINHLSNPNHIYVGQVLRVR